MKTYIWIAWWCPRIDRTATKYINKFPKEYNNNKNNNNLFYTYEDQPQSEEALLLPQ